MAYFHLVDEYPHNAASPTNQPGCFTCGAPKRIEGREASRPGGEYLLDLGVTTDIVQELDGSVHAQKVCVICESCLREAATIIGCMSPERGDELLGANVAQIQRIIELERIAEDYENLKREIAKVKV